jgi:starch synthase
VEIYFVTAEIGPYSRSSEVGDVCAALPKALRSIGHKVTVVSPLWPGIDPAARGLGRRLTGIEVALGDTRQTCTLYDGRTTGGVELLFVGGGAQSALFAGGPGNDEDGAQLDAALALCQVAVKSAAQRDAAPDVLHAHGFFGAAALPLCAEALPQTARVLSLHDVRQQGRVPAGIALPQAVRAAAGDGAQASLLRAGIAAAGRVVASSQTEAYALMQSDQAHGLQELLSAPGKLLGIANGLDAARWNPLTDPLLPSRFDPADRTGKARCKDALQLELGLPVRPDVPLLCCVGNTALLASLVETLLRNDMQLVVLADATDDLGALRAHAKRYSDRLALVEQADDKAQHRAVAAADLLLLPAHDAHYGDLHLAGQRYGALPLVRKLGAFADAVVDCDASLETGSGFAYENDDAAELLGAIQRALGAYSKRDAFEALRQRVMKLDLSWERSARRYEHAYRLLKGA